MSSTTFEGFSRSDRVRRRSAARAFWRKAAALAVCAAGLLGFGAAAVAANSLEDIDVASLPGDRIQVTLVMKEPTQEPLSFTIDNPARIALDFPDTTTNLERRSRTIGIGMARSITAVEARGRTRVVLNLAQMVPYETRVSGNKVFLTLDSSGAAPTTVAEALPGDEQHAVQDVDFRRGPEGQGRIIVTLSDPSVPVDMRQEGEDIIVEFLNTDLPQRLERRLDVVDFATPVQTIDTLSRNGATRMVISPSGEYDHLAYQSENVYTVEVKPITKAEKEAAQREKIGYTGERLSLNFQNIEVRAVLQLLADFTGLNIVVSDSVQGSLTLRLKNVPWDQAMDIILKTKGLAMRKTGNVILVAPSEELAAREKLELEAQKQIKELEPLRTEWFQINYAKASDLSALIKSQENSLLSPRGNITLDQRTNTLMIQDTPSQLEEIRRLITRLDVPVRQVLIESRVVIATDDFSRDLGVRFGVAKTTTFNDNHQVWVGGGGISGTTPSTSTGDLIVDLPVSEAGATQFGLAVGRIGNHILQLELSALQAEGRGEIISSPRVITANQKEAVIQQGVEIPYQKATSSGATSVSFKEAVLELRVTPQITPDDRVIMDLTVKKDNPDFANAVLGVPPVNTREVSTQVLVDNGETVVLGGVYERTKEFATTRTPFFSDLPLLGVLFRNKSLTDDKTELLIFVTPKIVKEELTRMGR